jgi:hypothetical protein
MPKSPEQTGGTPEKEKKVNFQEIFSMTPDKLTEEKKREIVERVLEEELKPEMLTGSLYEIGAEIRKDGGAEIFDDIGPFYDWVMGKEVDPKVTVYPFAKWREKEHRTEYVEWMKSFLERVRQEANQSKLPYELDFNFEEDTNGAVHIVLKVNKKKSSK